MMKDTVVMGMIVDNVRISFIDVCRQHGISEDMLLDMLEHGLIEDISSPNKNLVFEYEHLQRILSAYRLHTDLGINSPGVILALELLDELEDLRRQMDILRRHVDSI